MNQSDKTPAATTPGKPKDSGSRQQNHQGQSTQTGSSQADRDYQQSGGGSPGAKPAGAK